jgi:spore germination protein PC
MSKMNYWLQAQNDQINQMKRIIQHLQDNIATLEKEVKSLKDRPNTNIERIEYKFDQLKVETLEGTLNIGLTPSGKNTIDEFSVDNKELAAPNTEQDNTGLFKSLKYQVNDYLNNESKIFEMMEQKYNFPLEDQYRNFITNDIRQQIDDRIKLYINRNSSSLRDPHKIGYIEQEIFKKIKEEINTSIETFIQNLPKGNG